MGRKSETLVLQKKPPPQWHPNYNPFSARNLGKRDLAGVIFGCTNLTYKECIFKQLFGLPAGHIQYVQNITQGMPVFLFNYSDRKLHGIFEAISAGQWEINPYAWTSNDEEKTKYPAQVRVKIRVQCQSLTEDQYQPILAKNYRPHEPTHFWFELDKSQTDKLISLFSAFPVRQSVSTSHPSAKWGTLFRQSDAAPRDCSLRTTQADLHLRSSSNSAGNDNGKQKLEATADDDAPEKGNVTTSYQGKTWSSLFKPQADSISKKHEDSKKSVLEVHIPCVNQFSMLEPSVSKKLAVAAHIPYENPYNMLSESSCSQFSPHGENKPSEELTNIDTTNEVDEQVSSKIPNSKSADLSDALDANAYLTEISDTIAQSADVLNGNEVDEQVFSMLLNSESADLSDAVDANAYLTEISDTIAQSADMFNGEQDTNTVASDENCSLESNMEWASLLPHLDGQIELLEAHPLDVTTHEEDHMMPKPCSEASNFSSMSGTADLEDNTARDNLLLDDANATEMISKMQSSDLQTLVAKLLLTVEEMKSVQMTQSLKIQNLEQELVESNRKIEELRYDSGTLGPSKSSLSTGHVKETQFERYFQDSNPSILLVGGFDGSSWLPNLDTFLPFEDVMRSLEPMTSLRSYASAVILNGGLYVLGGGYGTSWYNTVELYNLSSQQWVSCPSLNRKKGSLAGACLSDKIFAIGGGNATDCFSEVEMLDLNMGKWIVTRSMVQKRFAPAAAQMNGVLYVVGGYDGQEYLKSVERFDPRECAWTRLKSMTTRRGCHSLTVLNEKLYAIGGYDGSQMVPTIEVFEPRVGSWMMSEPMKYARGYMGAATLGNTIFAIGGMQENEEILDTVECYSEGEGWQLTDHKSVGKRCFFSAVVV